MKKLTKEKRDHLILSFLITGIVLAGMWFGLIKFQQARLQALEKKKQIADGQLKDIDTAIKNSAQLQSEVNTAAKTLSELEENMAPSEPEAYAWVINTIRQFKLSYKVDVPQFSTIVAADMNMLPRFPYKQVTMNINGSAYYHELGRFIADFENRFPQIRIQNLEIEPSSGLTGGNDREKLSFKMDIVALVKSGA